MELKEFFNAIKNSDLSEDSAQALIDTDEALASEVSAFIRNELTTFADYLDGEAAPQELSDSLLEGMDDEGDGGSGGSIFSV